MFILLKIFKINYINFVYVLLKNIYINHLMKAIFDQHLSKYVNN